MNYSKNFSIVLFLLGFIATLQVGLVFNTERLIKAVEAFEPVVIERIHEIPVVEPETEETEVPEETAPVIVADLISRPMEIEPRIDCPLDDATQQMIYEKSQEYNVDFAFVMAVIFRESSFNPEAVGKTNDYGLMQINKVNHEWLSKELGITDFLDPEQNVTAGLYMLQDLFEKYDEAGLVLMAYNMGEPTAKKLWNQGIYSTDYAEAILQQTEIYEEELQERMGGNVSK